MGLLMEHQFWMDVYGLEEEHVGSMFMAHEYIEHPIVALLLCFYTQRCCHSLQRWHSN